MLLIVTAKTAGVRITPGSTHHRQFSRARNTPPSCSALPSRTHPRPKNALPDFRARSPSPPTAVALFSATLPSHAPTGSPLGKQCFRVNGKWTSFTPWVYSASKRRGAEYQAKCVFLERHHGVRFGNRHRRNRSRKLTRLLTNRTHHYSPFRTPPLRGTSNAETVRTAPNTCNGRLLHSFLVCRNSTRLDTEILLSQ